VVHDDRSALTSRRIAAISLCDGMFQTGAAAVVEHTQPSRIAALSRATLWPDYFTTGLGAACRFCVPGMWLAIFGAPVPVYVNALWPGDRSRAPGATMQQRWTGQTVAKPHKARLSCMFLAMTPCGMPLN